MAKEIKEVETEVVETEEVVAVEVELSDEEKEVKRLEECKAVGAAMLADLG